MFLFAIKCEAVETLAALPVHTVRSEAWQIKPGVSLGKVFLGEHIEAARSVLGKANPKSPNAGASMGHFWEVWSGKHHHELDVYSVRGPHDSRATPDVLVRQIRTTSPSFHTAGGIRVGSLLSQVQRELPSLFLVKKTDKMRLFDSRSRGIAIEIRDGRCAAILIHPKGRSVSGEYMDFAGYGT